MEYVDGLKGKIPDEELAVIKRYVEKQSREAAQAQLTVTPVDTVQYCSPSPQTPEPPPDVGANLENNEGKMDPELKELKSPLAGTGLETPGQQCPPNEGTWETERTTADGFLTTGVGSNQRGNISSPTERVDTRAGTKSTTITADNTLDLWQQREQAVRPRWKRREGTTLERGCKFISNFLGRALGHGRLVTCTSCFFCLCASLFSVL